MTAERVAKWSYLTPCLLALAGLCGSAATHAAPKAIPITDSTFDCISNLTPVRGFFVGSLTGNLKSTLKVARSKTGGVYPAGSGVPLVPTEVMVKQPEGFSPGTHDWEYFELDVSKDGSKIRKRGFAEVVNRFGGNCFTCHIRAKPEFDSICEMDHGCDPIPVTPAMIGALQRTDPRCKGAENVSSEDAAALKQLQDAMSKGLPGAEAKH